MYKHKRATIRLLFTQKTGHITMQGQTLCDTRILRPGSLCISFSFGCERNSRTCKSGTEIRADTDSFHQFKLLLRMLGLYIHMGLKQAESEYFLN